MFGDDFFEEIEKAFFGENVKQKTSSYGDVVEGEREERIIDYIEEENKIYFVFELFGYLKEDIKVNVGKNFVQVEAKKKNLSSTRDYLVSKLSKGIFIRKEIPKFKFKKFDWTFNNGILEVTINKNG